MNIIKKWLLKSLYIKKRQHELVSEYANINKLHGQIADDFISAIDSQKMLQYKLNKLQLPALLDELETLDAELQFLNSDIETMQCEGIEQKKYIVLLKQRSAAKKQKAAVLQEIAVIEDFENSCKSIERSE